MVKVFLRATIALKEATIMENLLKDYPPVLSVSDIAKILNVSTKTVRLLVKSGDLHCIRVGRLIRIPKDKLIDYINQDDRREP